jgi:hypothetical protein
MIPICCVCLRSTDDGVALMTFRKTGRPVLTTCPEHLRQAMDTGDAPRLTDAEYREIAEQLLNDLSALNTDCEG